MKAIHNKSSILSMRQEIAQGEKFYPKLADHHFYDEGKIIDFFDDYSFGENVDITSRALRYIEHNKKLEAGIDFGLMMSMVIGQPQGVVNCFHFSVSLGYKTTFFIAFILSSVL